MSAMEELIESLDNIEMSIANEEETRDQIRDDIARHCPIRKGDICEITARSHHGKQMRVISISWATSFNFPVCRGWILKGTVLRKDGTESLNIGQRFEPYA